MRWDKTAFLPLPLVKLKFLLKARFFQKTMFRDTVEPRSDAVTSKGVAAPSWARALFGCSNPWIYTTRLDIQTLAEFPCCSDRIFEGTHAMTMTPSEPCIHIQWTI